ncbi:hypothetical protein LPJ56_001721 [Coemansia sp. RSA 2599]|nr:hypothetical protein LPJ75_001337 [Coemansia sp. RSA 2598]KAJ1827331.1 hypothetical protein LPJ56_001721 [Coemansia sp. RSA 2599]
MSLPRISASLIVTAPLLASAARRAAAADPAAFNYRVLMVKRVGTGSFQDALVFPGGVQEPQDADSRTCAIRETFEETGLLLAKPPTAAPTVALDIGAQSFADLCAKHGLELPVCAQIGRWITPRAQKKRFDTRFFMLNVADDDRLLLAQLASARPQISELVSLGWFQPDEILEMNRRSELALFPPQFYILHELSRSTRWQDLASRGSSIRAGDADAVEPVLCKRSDGAVVGLLPGDAMYRCGETADAAHSAAVHVRDADLFCTPEDAAKQSSASLLRLHRLVMTRASSGGFYNIRLFKTATASPPKL